MKLTELVHRNIEPLTICFCVACASAVISAALICATYKQVHAQEQKKVEAVK